MKRFLRHVATGQWLSQDGKLTDQFEQAEEIASVEEAVDLCQRYRLKGMEIVLHFGPRSEVKIPIADY